MTTNHCLFIPLRRVAVALLLVCGFFAFGQEPAAVFSRYPEAVSGEYVVYRDYSWKAPTWTGFLCYDDSTWGAFIWTPSTASRVSILFRTEQIDDRLVLTGQQIVSTITNDDIPAVNYLMALLPDMYRWRLELKNSSSARVLSEKNSSLLPPKMTLSKTLETFGGEVKLTFSPEVPLFNLHSLSSKSGVDILSLYCAGRLGSGGDKDFFSFVPEFEPTKKKSSKSLKLDKRAVSEQRSVDGISLNLDSQWTMMADNVFFMGNTAVLLVDTIILSDAGISLDDLPLAMSRLFSLSSSISRIDPAAFKITGNAKKFRIENLVSDITSGTQNQDFKTCILSEDGLSCKVISLSVTKAAWTSNQSYFNSLF